MRIAEFQSRNRDTFLFKRWHIRYGLVVHKGFNLVIEILFFSSVDCEIVHTTDIMFQSRNRDTFLFKIIGECGQAMEAAFQSRNRDTFLFKRDFTDIFLKCKGVFQSRNRDTFLFKSVQDWDENYLIVRFNLVIEILFFSRVSVSPRHAGF